MKNQLLSFLLAIFCTGLFGQNNDYMWSALVGNAADYDSICIAYENYLRTTYPDSIPESAMGAVKRYHRYNYFWNSRLGFDNGQTSYMPYTRAAVNNMLNPICAGADDASWELMGPSSYPTQWLGLVDEVLYDPQNSSRIILSADRGGIWIREDTAGTEGWSNVTDNLRLPGLCASEIIRNPFDHDHLLASTASGLLNSGNYGIGIIESIDNGDTWSVQESFPYQTAPFIARIIADPNDTIASDSLTLYAISNNNGHDRIFRSLNSGDVWSVFPGPPEDSIYYIKFNDIEMDDQGSIYLSSQGRWGSKINGKFFKYQAGQWIDCNANGTFGNFKRMRLSKPSGGKIFALCDGYLGGIVDSLYKRRIFKTTDYGATWTVIKEISPGYPQGPTPQCEIEYSPASDIIYLGEVQLRIFKDDGVFEDVYITPLHVDIRDFDITGIWGSNERVLIATDGGITLAVIDTSNISNISFTDMNGSHLPIGNMLGIGVSNTNGEMIVGGAVHCHSWIYENNAWDKFGSGDGGDCEINWIDPGIYYYQMNQDMRTSSNPTQSIYNNKSDWFIGMQYELHPTNPYQVFFGRGGKMVVEGLDTTYPSHLMKYDELTGVLTEIQVSENLKKVGPVAIINDSTFYVADFNNESGNTADRMMKSTNGGLSWNDLSLNTVYHKPGGNWVPYNDLGHTIDYKSISGIVTNPISPDNIWVGITGVWTDNNGEPDPGKFRVLHSTNGGSTWYDYSEGLPAFPIEALEYQPGSNDRIFAGTDVGVFYRDAGMSQWECFSNQLPVCIITDLDYESCSRTLYASTYGRAIFKTYIPFDVEVSTDTLASQANIHWNQPRQIHNNIFIPAGTTLTVTGNLYMDMGTSIIVDRSANLIVENCTITNACDELWNGIEVWGYADTSQYYSGVQGRIDLENAEISNMQTGIIAAKTKQGGYDRGFEGGIIRAKDCSFINNNRSIALGPYQNFHPVSGNEMDNFSRFERCTFKVTSANSEHVNLEHHAYLASVKGIRFKGCYFSDESALSMPSSGTVGIYSVGSSFVVAESCLDPTISPCQQFQTGSFLRLNYGVKAYGLRKGNSCIIEKATFTNNYTGVYLSAMDGSTVNLNSFSMNNPYDSTHTSPLLCGLYLDHCTGYQVEENDFYSNYSPATQEHTVGITVNNSGEEDNRIYNNICSNLFAGILAQNQNRDETGDYGLEIKCNDFSICEYDIAVTADTAYKDVGIKASQGSNDDDPEAPANNIFSYTHNNPVSDYYNEGADIVYWYLNDTISMVNLQPANYSNPEVNPLPNTAYSGLWDEDENCPSSFSSNGGGGIEENRSEMADAETKIDSTKNLLDLLVDGGDTEALSTEVETSFPDEAVELRNELIATSPYLSDSVMVNTVEQENVLTEAMVTEILIANPQSAKSDTVQQALDNRFDQLTENQRADIDQGWFVTGAKESLESNLAYYRAQRQQALNNIIRIFRNDSLCVASNDSIIAVLVNENSLSSKYALAFEYYAKADYSTASTTLNNIPATFNLGTEQGNQHQLYVDYMNLLIQLSNQNKSLMDCDSTQQAILSTVFNNANGSLQMLARNALINLDAISYIEPYILPGEGLKEEKIRRVPVRKYYTEDKFKLYPNPAASYVIIEYILSGEIPEGFVYFIDNKGAIVKHLPIGKSHDYLVVPIEDLPSGIYYCKFVAENKASQVEKLIISR